MNRARDERPAWPAWLELGKPVREVARIWATVDLDRTLTTLGGAADLLPEDALLGARVALVRTGDDVPLAILEPSTEGRLAAWLARHGEGVAGQYVEVEDLETVRVRAATDGAVLSRPANGPFGTSVLVIEGPAAGRQLVLVESRAGTIDR